LCRFLSIHRSFSQVHSPNFGHDDRVIRSVHLSVVAMLVLVVASLVAAPETVQAQSPAPFVAPALSARGAYRVGLQTVVVTDAEHNRNLTLEVWYPAILEADQEKTEYRSQVGRTNYVLPGRAGRDAPPLETVSRFPLLIFSHGQPDNRMQSANLLEHLASQGFVVAAIDHTGSTNADVTVLAYADGLVYRPQDILFVASEIPKRFPTANANNVGLIGFSYGGYSSLNAAGIGLDSDHTRQYCAGLPSAFFPCAMLPFLPNLETQRGAGVVRPDPRIKAVFVMAPYGGLWMSEAQLETMRLPLFIAVGNQDNVAVPARDASMIFERSGSSPKYLLSLEGAGHHIWVACPPEVIGTPDEAGCNEPAVWDRARAHALTQHFATAFFKRFLKSQNEFEPYLNANVPGVPDRSGFVFEARNQQK
jgi:predicted dienelactone hydrolase